MLIDRPIEGHGRVCLIERDVQAPKHANRVALTTSANEAKEAKD